MKREYMKPAMQVCELQQKCHILAGSDFDTLDTNFTEEDLLEYGGGGDYDAR